MLCLALAGLATHVGLHRIISSARCPDFVYSPLQRLSFVKTQDKLDHQLDHACIVDTVVKALQHILHLVSFYSLAPTDRPTRDSIAPVRDKRSSGLNANICWTIWPNSGDVYVTRD